MNPYEITYLSINVYGAMQKFDEWQRLMNLVYYRPHETVLEIGSGRGGTLWAWSKLPNNKTVISLDLPGGEFGGGLTEDDKERIKNWMELDKNTYLCAADSHSLDTFTVIKETLQGVSDGEVDILFIDGDHTYEGVKKDFMMYSELCKKGGLIVFHDIRKHAPESGCEVERFWNEVKYGYEYQEFISGDDAWGGIGVLKW